MAGDLITEPEDKFVRFGPDVVEHIRKQNNLDKKEDREKAIAIIDDWIKSQDHFLKKDYSKTYIERCIVTCNGSLERTKTQIDTICTLRTLLPHFFQITTLKNNEDIQSLLSRGMAAFLPKLTKDYYRVVVIKAKPKAVVSSSDFSQLFKCLVYMAEYLKTHDYFLGVHVVFDIIDVNVSDVLPNLNLVELQQILPIYTKGYGVKIKGIFIMTASKLVENFFKLLKPLFSAKIASRIHAVTDRQLLRNYISIDVLASDYGGPEKSIQELHDDLIERLSTVHVQELVKEMKKGLIDVNKRRTDEFNNEYMGMPGTFRTLSLD